MEKRNYRSRRWPYVRLSVLLLVLVQILVACGGNSGTTQSGPVKLVIWTESTILGSAKADPNTPAGKYGNYLIKQFEKNNPNVKVVLEYHGWDEDLRQNLLNSLVAGTGPDIVVGENFFQQYAQLGSLVPLDDDIGDIKNNLIPGTYQAAVYNDHIYGLSAFTGVFGFERNCKVIKEAGLDCDKPPTTWDELLQQAQTINQKGKGKYYGYTLQGPIGAGLGSVFRLAVYLNQANASLCQDNCSKPWFNNPNAVPVYEFLRKLNKLTPPGLTFNPDEGQLYSQLFKNVAAYQMAGSWHPTWAKQSGCEDCRYSPIPKPANGVDTSVIVGNAIYAVLKQSKHQDIAKKWVKYLASDEVQNSVFSSLGRLPSTRSALTALRPSADTATQSYIDILLNSKNLTVLPQWRTSPQKIWEAYNGMLTKILTTDEPIQKLLDDGQATAEQVAVS